MSVRGHVQVLVAKCQFLLAFKYGLPNGQEPFDIIESDLKMGEKNIIKIKIVLIFIWYVAVEGDPGHDIGVVLLK